MPTRLSRSERDAFLSDVRVGVLSVASNDPDRAPVSAPIWYTYSPETGISVMMNRTSRKGVAIDAAKRFSLVVQSESLPYRYVTVEGPVVEIRGTEGITDVLPLAIRYLGEEQGTAYAKGWYEAGAAETDFVYTMKPTKWNTADFTNDLG
ncbi:pyridoxamine 5'-phosphate oxidase family protein [Kribbella solani]|uniref:Nitroimidazol reductase NimA-like FMN-containing flavoprotein (Pyridoxamine 5'-phosphate oxidase superfamily) n=1 Tax=Kribbella solani TaxID=236067 RepID=A0A841DYF0_9ACTN|nr:pyridoxamine 5'-phosphate oxidase family protein [Kribbella solani]MBB5981805.1 nitroimidazol reductase NimA-like FMN-containing flavoprotein (pyridoxamine 5'-phosphate oxidase superfamily) [Kribbella solani]MDX2969286.1 pyridoxamine 5'-phosphate oxidase family protein [Kribbella solani]MDX3001417.1 pyridoxamine 5'-phosphate oxidase family protein [Kribbella solani]